MEKTTMGMGKREAFWGLGKLEFLHGDGDDDWYLF
jgi:hypothetical protein